MLARTFLSEAERQVDPQLGYPRGYAKLCRNAATQLRGLITPFTEGPPQRFIPYAPQPDEIARLKDLDSWFPVLAEEDRDPPNARKYADFLWRQLDHLGNAGFDPAKFRVDMYGNVLYWHADAGSPLAWEIDHWFPHSRGGKTVMSNLRVLQWQTNQRKSNKLEFLVPWWDLQLGVSVNQFLSAFASKNAEFRKRSLLLFFAGGEEEEADGKRLVESHSWPAPFREQKGEIGLAAAAVVSVSRRDNDDKIRGTASWASRSAKDLSIELSAVTATGTPARRRWSLEEEEALRRAVLKFGPGSWKEIKESEHALASRSTVQIKDKYRLLRGDWHPDKENVTANVDKETAVAAALQKETKLKQMREDEKKVKEEELAHLEETLGAITRENEAEFLALEDLERVLVTSREKVEKQRRWSETQSSYRICLERMIRDTMHQSVVYKEQARLNQAACNALQVRLDCEKQTSVAAGSDLVKKYKQREELLALSLPDQLDNELAKALEMQAMSSFALAEGEEEPEPPKLTDSEHRWLPRLPSVAEDSSISRCALKAAGMFDKGSESSDKVQGSLDTRSSTRSLQAEEELVSSLRSLKLSSISDVSRSPAEGSSGKRSLDEEKEKLGRAGREGSRLKKKKKVDDKDSSDFRFHKAALHEVEKESGKDKKLMNRPVGAVDKDLGRDRTVKEVSRRSTESGAPSLISWSSGRGKLPEGDAETGNGPGSGSGTTYLRAIEGDRLQKVDKVSRVTEWLDAVPTPRPIRGQERSEVFDSNEHRLQEHAIVEEAELEADADGDSDDIEEKITMVGFEYGDAGRATLLQETETGPGEEEDSGRGRSSRRDARRLRRGDAVLQQVDAWLEVGRAREVPKSSEGESEEQKDVIVVESPVRHEKEEPLLDEILHDMLDAHLSNSADAEEVDEDEKIRQLGKSNLDKWLHVLLHKEAIAPEEPSNVDGEGNEEVCPGTPQAEEESLERLRMNFTNAVAKERSEQEGKGEKPTGLLVAMLKKLSFRPPVEPKHWLRSSLSVKRTEETKAVCEEQEGTLHGRAVLEEFPAATLAAARTSDEDVCGVAAGDLGGPSSSLRSSIKACTVAWKRAVKKMETRPVSTTWALM